jgi:hypothetical protein
MMEDNAVAKIVVSSIIGEEVLELVPKPQEHTREKLQIGSDSSSLTVYRLDFSAKIKVSDGQKLVHIEMQKASLPTDIPRFRRYLGEQFTDPNNNIKTLSGTVGLQIYCIYFLGKDLGLKDAPVLKISPNVVDVATSEIIDTKSDFIDSLHHKSWVVQINCLKARRRTELEQLLSVFDQSNITKDWHILNVSEEDFPEKFRPIIRRLKSAAGDSNVKKQMKVEDEFLRYLQDCIRVERDKAIEEKDKTIEESKKTIEEKDNSLAEKDKSLAEKDKSLAEKDKEIAKLKRLLEK